MKYKMSIAAILMFNIVTGMGGQAEKQQTDPKGVRITMQRTACYGFCPVYTVVITGDGTVEYEGVKFVGTEGKKTHKIPVASVNLIVNEFNKIGYFGLQDEYTADLTDLPTTITSISIDGRTKSVKNYWGAPKTLVELEHRIDQLSEILKYINKG